MNDQMYSGKNVYDLATLSERRTTSRGQLLGLLIIIFSKKKNYYFGSPL